MLESLDPDLACHRGAPDKTPERRLATLEAAGAAGDPLHHRAAGRDRRVARRAASATLCPPSPTSHRAHGHVQEVIVQNFLPKPGTAMHNHPPCPPEELWWTIAVARLVLPAEVHVQAPPNLSDDLRPLLDSGLDDWGGVSPVTVDHVNPERAWPAVDLLARGDRGCRPHPGRPPHRLSRVSPRTPSAGSTPPCDSRSSTTPTPTASDEKTPGAREARRAASPPGPRPATATGPPAVAPRPGRRPSPRSSPGWPGPGGRRGRDRDAVLGARPRGPGRGRGGRPVAATTRSATS